MAESAASAKTANDARVDLFDVGASNPTLVIYTASYGTALLTFNLDGTAAFGASTTACPSVATATGLPISATAAATGTAASYKAFDGDGTELRAVASLTGVTLSNTAITSGDVFDLTSFTISQPC